MRKYPAIHLSAAQFAAIEYLESYELEFGYFYGYGNCEEVADAVRRAVENSDADALEVLRFRDISIDRLRVIHEHKHEKV